MIDLCLDLSYKLSLVYFCAPIRIDKQMCITERERERETEREKEREREMERDGERERERER